MTGTSPIGAATCRRPCGISSRSNGFFAMIIPQPLRRPGVLRLCAFLRAGQDRSRSIRDRLLDRRGAQLPGPAELLNALRYRGAEGSLPAATGARRGHSLLRAHRAARRFRCRLDSGHRHRLPGKWQGREVLGMRLNFSKRYITLAPVATVIGLAFRMFDPERLLGGESRSRHHLCPDSARYAGRGDRQAPFSAQHPVPERTGARPRCVRAARVHHRRPEDGGPGLAHAGRAALGGPLHLPALERHRRRQGRRLRHRRLRAHPPPVQHAGGQVRGRRAGDRAHGRPDLHHGRGAQRHGRARSMRASARRCRPASSSTTSPRWAARVANDAMDVHGGKGIMLGPRNYLGRGYQSMPIAITVEGANILTRSLIIFGQGAIRCHPYRAARDERGARSGPCPRRRRVRPRAVRSRRLYDLECGALAGDGATLARFQSVPDSGPTRRYYQHIERFSASFAFATDVAMLTLGGYLKKKETISARLGDVLSARCTWPRWCSSTTRTRAARRPICPSSSGLPGTAVQAQEQLHGVLRNFPSRAAGARHAAVDISARTHLLCAQRPARAARSVPGHESHRDAGAAGGVHLQDSAVAQSARPIAAGAETDHARRTHGEAHPGRRREDRAHQRAGSAGPDRAGRGLGIITPAEASILDDYDAKVMEIISVDDFAPEELGVGAAPA